MLIKLFQDEYSSFYFKEADKNLNGDLTAGENTADNGGVWESMYGFNYSRAREADKFIPGLSENFTQDQLFYINFGQIWCAKYREEYAKWMVDNDPHSPGRLECLTEIILQKAMNSVNNMKYFLDSEQTVQFKTQLVLPKLSDARKELQ